jgi:hypothetical protein
LKKRLLSVSRDLAALDQLILTWGMLLNIVIPSVEETLVSLSMRFSRSLGSSALKRAQADMLMIESGDR